MGTRWPLSGQMAFDNNGTPAPGAKAYFYIGGTTTPYTVYADAAETTPATDPVLADGNGRWPTTFIPFGTYKEVIKTIGGITLSTADNIPNDAPVDTSASVDANAILQTGDVLLGAKNGTRPGFVRLNGRSIGNASSSATERANADTEALFAFVWTNTLDAQCAVSGGRGGSAAADYAANKRITLPDVRNANVFGFGDMGNTDAGLMGSAPVVSGSAILAGSIIGANTHTLLTAQMPVTTPAGSISLVTGSVASVTPTGSITMNSYTPAGSVNVTNGTQVLRASGSGGVQVVVTASTISIDTVSASFSGTPATLTGSFTGNALGAQAFTGNAQTFTGTSFGSGTAHNIVSRGVPFTVLMKL